MPVFALQPANDGALIPLGKKGSTRITEAELKQVDGLTIRTWMDWPMEVLDSGVALAKKLGKFYTILVCGGDVADPSAASHLAKVEAHIKKLGERFSNDTLCWGVHVTGCSKQGHSEELFWGKPMPPKVVAANKRLIAAWGAAFPRAKVILAGSANDPAAIRQLFAHGKSVVPWRFIYKINSLSAKTPVTGWVGTDLIVEAAKTPSLDYGYEMLQPSNHPKFGGTWNQMLDNKKGLEKRAGKPPLYWAVYRLDVGAHR